MEISFLHGGVLVEVVVFKMYPSCGNMAVLVKNFQAKQLSLP